MKNKTKMIEKFYYNGLQAYWITPDGDLYHSIKNHPQFVRQYPHIFKMLDYTHEDDDSILLEVLKNGYIRLRESENTWYISCYQFEDLYLVRKFFGVLMATYHVNGFIDINKKVFIHFFKYSDRQNKYTNIKEIADKHIYSILSGRFDFS